MDSAHLNMGSIFARKRARMKLRRRAPRSNKDARAKNLHKDGPCLPRIEAATLKRGAKKRLNFLKVPLLYKTINILYIFTYILFYPLFYKRINIIFAFYGVKPLEKVTTHVDMVENM